MKNLFALTAAVVFGFSAAASNVQLVVQAVDNGGAVNGNTYRIYAELPSSQHSIHAIFADGEHMLNVTSTGSFYQSQLGGATTIDVNEAVIGIDESLAYDSWVTVGAENSSNNNLWNIGIDFASFNNGGALEVVDGAWFVVPTDVRAVADARNLVLLMQITTDGTATGTLNMQGWNPDGETWRDYDVTFTTTDAEVFGCTNPDASNYSVEATYDNGNCQFATDNGPMADLFSLENSEWNVFPNPIFEGHFSIQFDQEVNLGSENIILEVTDMSGKTVMSQEANSGSIIGGNRIMVKHSLAAGAYTLSVAHKDFSAATNLIVKK
jgi:hypothetical protein